MSYARRTVLLPARCAASACGGNPRAVEAFRATGLTLDHVNAHHHFHLHPTIQQTLLRLAPEFDIRAVRLPLEPPAASGKRWAWLTGFMEARQARRLRDNLDIAGMAHNDWMFGLADTGAMTAERVRHYLEQIPDGVSELYFHPATARPSVWPANYRYADEAAALIDPEAQAIIRDAASRSCLSPSWNTGDDPPRHGPDVTIGTCSFGLIKTNSLTSENRLDFRRFFRRTLTPRAARLISFAIAERQFYGKEQYDPDQAREHG